MTIQAPVSESRCGCGGGNPCKPLLTLEEATGISRSLAVRQPDVEPIRLTDAAGRVCASDVHAPAPMPFFDQAAMDGFAVRIADLHGESPWRLPVAGTVAAGECATGDLPSGMAMRIFTGAPVPPGADAVVMCEYCEDAGGHVTFRSRPVIDGNIRRAGSDTGSGQRLIAAGTRIEARHVGLLAANGLGSLDVFRRPRVGVFSTGSELLSRGGSRNGRIFDANRPMLLEMCGRAGADAIDLGTVDDDPLETVRFFGSVAGKYDMLVSSGGISAGARDFIPWSLRESGGIVRGRNVAIKPGKPVLFATLGDAAYVALPGNPLAAFVCFELFGRELVGRLGGEADAFAGPSGAIAGFAAKRKPGRTELVPARIASRSACGLPELVPLGNGSSGSLHPLCLADGLALIPSQADHVAHGDRIGFIAL